MTLAEKLRQNNADRTAAAAVAATVRSAKAAAKEEASIVKFFAQAKSFITHAIESGKSQEDINVFFGYDTRTNHVSVDAHPDVASALKLRLYGEACEVSIAKSPYASHWSQFTAWARANGLHVEIWHEADGYGNNMRSRGYSLRVVTL